jgi:phosphoglycolate phosphatase-like HAD superfamily hydrolase
MTLTYTKEFLLNLKPQHSSFVGIDSDGCVFDTMEIKQKKCFHGLIVSHWHLEPIEKYVREAAEFANLYSKWRGQNRFPALTMTFDLLRERPEVIKSGVRIPDLPVLKKFMASGVALGNPSLEKAVQETNNPELRSVLRWSKDVNVLIGKTVKKVPPFKWALESLKKIAQNSDTICVSQTPAEALIREWNENDLTKYVSAIAGQELGTKAEHITLATKDRYTPDKILMIGDAEGDMKAARANNALFFPVCPAHEEQSWERFHKEAYDKFLGGTYAGEYEAKLIAEFQALLPDTPVWKRGG